LLGSYDPITRRIMDILKREVVGAFSGTNIYVYLLDEVSIFANHEFFVVVEKWREKSLSVFIFDHNGKPMDNLELKITKGDVDALLRREISKKYNKDVIKLPILEKFKILAEKPYP